MTGYGYADFIKNAGYGYAMSCPALHHLQYHCQKQYMESGRVQMKQGKGRRPDRKAKPQAEPFNYCICS